MIKDKLHIGMILDNEFTGDMRVENEVQALQKAGYQVFVFCINHGNKLERENYHGAKIIRIKLSKFWKKKLNGLNNTIINIYPTWWKNKIIKLAKENNIDVLHVHDLWLLEGALLANKTLKVKIVADLHENYVHALANYKWSTSFPGNLLVSQEKWKRKEIEWLKKVDDIIVVIEEAKTRVQELIGNKKSIHVVANYVNIDEFKAADKNYVNLLKDRFAENITLTYTGGFDLHRGLENLVEAIPIILKTFPNFLLVLVGSGSNENDLKELSIKLNIDKHITFEGWQKPEVLPAYIQASDACVIPHMKTEHTDKTIPHKLFQYMLYEKPVLTSNCEPLKRIVNETGSGEVFIQSDVSDIAQKVIEVLSDPNTMVTMGSNGREAVLNKYNWDETAKALVSLYNKIA